MAPRLHGEAVRKPLLEMNTADAANQNQQFKDEQPPEGSYTLPEFILSTVTKEGREGEVRKGREGEMKQRLA